MGWSIHYTFEIWEVKTSDSADLLYKITSLISLSLGTHSLKNNSPEKLYQLKDIVNYGYVIISDMNCNLIDNLYTPKINKNL